MIGSFWGFFGVTAILKAYDGLHQIDQNSLWGDCRRKPQAFGFREFGTKWKAGGGPAAGYFFCLPKRSNQENAPTLRPDRFGCGNLVNSFWPNVHSPHPGGRPTGSRFAPVQIAHPGDLSGLRDSTRFFFLRQTGGWPAALSAPKVLQVANGEEIQTGHDRFDLCRRYAARNCRNTGYSSGRSEQGPFSQLGYAHVAVRRR